MPHDRYVTITGYAQGGTYAVKFNLNGVDGMIPQSPEEIRDSIDAILKAVDSSLSGYNGNSLLSRFNRGEAVKPDSLFVDIYRRGYDIYKSTGGVVDVASAPLFDIWGFGFKTGNFPDDTQVSAVRSGCGMQRLSSDMMGVVGADGTLRPEDMLIAGSTLPALNYNAIAQGYSCDLVAAYLYGIGVKDMMVDIGEIFCDGLNPSGKQWTIGIDRPADGNNESGADVQAIFRVPSGARGVVTSGNYRKFYVKDGKKYAHTIDPRTGYPVSHNLLSATIIAEDALMADAYATYCMVVGLDEAVQFIKSQPDIEGCLIYNEDGIFMTWCSEGMEML